MLKYKKNKNAALICSITGGALFVGGIVIAVSEIPGLIVGAAVSGGAEGSSVGPILMISGLSIAIASAPFFALKRKHLVEAKLYLSSVQNKVGPIIFDNAYSHGFSVVIPLN